MSISCIRTDKERDCWCVYIYIYKCVQTYIYPHTYIFKPICVDVQSCQSQQCLVRTRSMVEDAFLPSWLRWLRSYSEELGGNLSFWVHPSCFRRAPIWRVSVGLEYVALSGQSHFGVRCRRCFGWAWFQALCLSGPAVGIWGRGES